MDTVLGIDLGTTNSVVSILKDDLTVVIPVELDSIHSAKMLPSAVGIDASGKLLVGTSARNQALLGPEKTILSVKRQMGTDALLKLGDQQFSPQEVSAIILRTLKERAEQHVGHSVSKAVITVPAFFNDKQRQATYEAGALAGLEVIRLINEPTAAALTYDVGTQENKKLLVYDLGGGTFDVSIVQVEQGVVEVLSSHGDTHLGGDDFDQLLLNHVADLFQQEHQVDLRSIPAAHSRLRHEVEEAKKQLSFEPYVNIDIPFIAEHKGKPLNLSAVIERSDYQELIRPLLEKTISSVDDALNDARLYAKDIDTVILVGGSTRTPLLQEIVAEKLGQQPLSSVDPDLCVAMGAAIQGGLIQGQEVGPVLVDITPHTMGVRCLSVENGIPTDRFFAPIINRNTPLPAKRSHIFYTNYPGQEVALFDIHQGEHSDATLNDLVGTITLEGLDKQADAQSEILVRFDLDMSGTLHATVIERNTSLEKSISIDNAITRFQSQDHEQAKRKIDQVFNDSPCEIAEDQSTCDPESHLSPQVRERMERAASLIIRAENIFVSAPEPDQKEITVLLTKLKAAVEEDAQDDETDFDTTVAELDDLLFYLQDN